jgi:P pilus assembly chaperone PapD
MFFSAWTRSRSERIRQLAPCLLAGLMLFQQPASAGLMLHPTRLVFDKNQRAAQVELINDGKETASYRILLVNRRMTETGQFEAVEAPGPGEQFADAMLRYSPRQVTLQPGTSQTVRVMLRKPADLAEGEYRSQLQFERLPDADANASLDKQADNKGIGVVLNTLVGASIPVIVRHGNTSATVRLTGLALRQEAGQPALALQFEREGNSSVYGDIKVDFTPRAGKAQTLAQVGGIAVYTPNAVRKAIVPLSVPAGTLLSHGTLEVSYRDRPEAGGKLLAQATLELP